MKNILVLLSIVLFSFTASAYDMGLGVGFRTNDADSTNVPAFVVDGQSTLQLGGIVWADISEKLVFRTGFMYSQLHYEVGLSSKVELDYLMVPVTLMFKAAEFGGVFAGVNVGLNVGDDCGSFTCDNVKSTVMPFTIGGYFKAAPQVAIELFYESIATELLNDAALGIEDANSVGLNVLFTFD